MKEVDHNLFLHKNGRYYIRYSIASTRFRYSCRTKSLSKALQKRDEHLGKVNAKREFDVVARRMRAQYILHGGESITEPIKRPVAEVENKQLIEKFIADRRDFQKTSGQEMDRYIKTIEAFIGFNKNVSISAITKPQCDSFIRALMCAPKRHWWDGKRIVHEQHEEMRLSSSTVHTIGSYIKTFYKYLSDEKCIENNPTIGLRLPRPSKSKKRNPPTPEVAQQLRAINPPAECHISSEAWFLFINIISRIGARLCELSSLEKANVIYDVDIPFIKIQNKKGKHGRDVIEWKLLPIPTAFREPFKKFVDKQSDGYVFSSLGIYNNTHKSGLKSKKYGIVYSRKWIPLAKRIYPPMDVHTWRHYVNTCIRSDYEADFGCIVLGHRGKHGVNDMYNHTSMKKLLDIVDSIP